MKILFHNLLIIIVTLSAQGADTRYTVFSGSLTYRQQKPFVYFPQSVTTTSELAVRISKSGRVIGKGAFCKYEGDDLVEKQPYRIRGYIYGKVKVRNTASSAKIRLKLSGVYSFTGHITHDSGRLPQKLIDASGVYQGEPMRIYYSGVIVHF